MLKGFLKYISFTDHRLNRILKNTYLRFYLRPAIIIRLLKLERLNLNRIINLFKALLALVSFFIG